MPRIHVPKNKSPQPSCGFLTLIDAADADQQAKSPYEEITRKQRIGYGRDK
jgi:hypothetical protein